MFPLPHRDSTQPPRVSGGPEGAAASLTCIARCSFQRHWPFDLVGVFGRAFISYDWLRSGAFVHTLAFLEGCGMARGSLLLCADEPQYIGPLQF
jgi:hypothetical protein